MTLIAIPNNINPQAYKEGLQLAKDGYIVEDEQVQFALDYARLQEGN
tara:strand:+ start:667 stop:807 length:141 start_codon:yes stop_codon:yes gene_type:complete